jgi:DNA primase
MKYSPWDVEDVLNRLDLEWGYSNKGWALMLCPFHDDHHPSFTVNLDDGFWMCFSRCGRGDIVQLTARRLNLSTKEAISWLGRGIAAKPLTHEKVVEALSKKEQENEAEFGEFYDIRRVPRFMYNRGFNPATLKKFKVGFSEIRNAAVIPCGKHRIFRHPPGHEPRYEYTQKFPKASLLFGIEHWIGPDMIVVEGSLDCIWMHQLGFTNTVSILGSKISQKQCEIIARTAERVYLLLDNDSAGINGVRLAVETIPNKVYVAELPAGKDPIISIPALPFLL